MKPFKRLQPLFFGNSWISLENARASTNYAIVTFFALITFVFAQDSASDAAEQQHILSEENAVSHATHDDCTIAPPRLP